MAKKKKIPREGSGRDSRIYHPVTFFSPDTIAGVFFHVLPINNGRIRK